MISSNDVDGDDEDYKRLTKTLKRRKKLTTKTMTMTKKGYSEKVKDILYIIQ